MFRLQLRALTMVLAAVAMLAVVAGDADARPRFSVGSRGARTYSAPPSTATAPNAAHPIERSTTQPGAATAARPSPAAASGLFNRPGILGGMVAGFLGAGLFGLLFGHGLFGGLGGLASVMGLLLQLAVVFLVGRLIWTWWQRRSQPAFAGHPSVGLFGGRSIFGLGGSGGGSAQPEGAPLQLKPEDFDAFERLLEEILTAYGAEDTAGLRSRTTPEVLSFYSEEIARNASYGNRNPISDVKLLQGDLSEAWSEDDEDYATVAMRYSLNDRLVDRKNGQLVEQLPSEATEWWTFTRARGGQWILSAVQQSG